MCGDRMLQRARPSLQTRHPLAHQVVQQRAHRLQHTAPRNNSSASRDPITGEAIRSYHPCHRRTNGTRTDAEDRHRAMARLRHRPRLVASGRLRLPHKVEVDLTIKTRRHLAPRRVIIIIIVSLIRVKTPQTLAPPRQLPQHPSPKTRQKPSLSST